ncbi:MAG: poly(A) polymerase [Evtepia sp.]|nr:poly(A) polymerase [Evtepia sp.]
MDWIIEQVRIAMELLETAGFEAFLVGGCVRDSLMGMTPKDFDLTTNAKPKEIIQAFAAYRVIETGLQHGTITVILDQISLEITTYRREKSYTDSRHPDGVEFSSSLEEDLTRRDFTMNAIAYHPDKGFVDLSEGRLDIQRKLIRCVGDPDERFGEDALRILRALRFSSVLGFHMEARTEAALFRNKAGLKLISAERTAAELNQLLCGKEVKRVLLRYIDVLGEVIPELLPMKGFEQRTRYHNYDVLQHTSVALEHTPPDAVLRWAVLLHDSGKPATFTTDDRGNGHFYGHHTVSGALSKQVLCRLKLDRSTRERVITLVELHDASVEAERKAVRRWLSRLTPSVFFDLLQVKRADNWGQAPEFHTRQNDYDELEELAVTILAEDDCISRKDLAVNGRDLMEKGLKGRELGQILQFLLDAVVDEKVENERTALLCYIGKYQSLSK